VSFVDSFDISSQETGNRELAFSSDGTKFFVTGYQGVDVGEYSMSTAWDVSTASYTDAFSVSSQEAYPHGLAFNTDGTKMFVSGYGGDNVNEYTLSTGWDVSTASFVDSFDVSSQDIQPRGLAFSTDGTKMFISGNVGNTIEEYTLSTGFDVSTSSHTDTMDVSGYDTDTRGVTFNDDGTRMFYHGQQNDEIYDFSLSTAFDISIAILLVQKTYTFAYS
jgi:DNA-binding beta-propeller fold protein YncE